ncbi:OmpA family protein [Ottowia oryzae]
MTSNDNDDNQGVVWAILIGVILLAISLAVGMGLYRTSKAAGGADGAVSTSAAVGAPMGAPVGAAPGSPAEMTNAADVPSIRVENGVVKFYFPTGSAALANGAAEALGDVVKGVAAGRKAVISGFTDVTGDPAKNEELAKQRAFAVRDALAALGIGEDKVDLRKPEAITATGSNAEARRVEVTLQ